MSLCNEFNSLKSSMSTGDLKRVLGVAIPLYLNELLRNGGIEEAEFRQREAYGVRWEK